MRSHEELEGGFRAGWGWWRRAVGAWRMEGLGSLEGISTWLEEGNMEDCVFCGIAEGRVPSEILYSDERVVAFRDIEPQAPVHFLVVPRRHVESAFHLKGEDGDLLAAMFAAARQVCSELGVESSGARILTNVGPDAGQVVMHFHLHVLGGRPMGWPPG